MTQPPEPPSIPDRPEKTLSAPPYGNYIDDADRALAAALPANWDIRLHVGDNAKAADAIREWRFAKGL